MDVLCFMFAIILITLSLVNSASIVTKNINYTNHSFLNKLIVFSFDGFRPDYIDSIRTPNLYSISLKGVQGKMRSTFITKTFPNHQSIVTGLYQPWHGITNNKFFDPSLDSYFDVNNSSSLWWDQFNISVPIYIANQFYETNRHSIAIQWPGSIANYSNGTNPNKRICADYLLPYYSNHSLEDGYRKIDILMKWLTDPIKPANLAFVYFNEPDLDAHEYGPFSKEVYQQVINLDLIVGYFRKKLDQFGLKNHTNIIYLSDHGMAEININRSIYLYKCEDEFPGLKFKQIGSSPTFSVIPISAPLNWNQSFSFKSLSYAVNKALNLCSKRMFNNKFKAYIQEKIPDVFHYKNNIRILPIFVSAEEGYNINYQPSNWIPKGFPIWGNHGYNASLESMRPLFLAEGPRFKNAYRHLIQFDNVDLYPLMLKLLDIPLELFPSNGTLNNVQRMLAHPFYLNIDDIVLNYKLTYSKWFSLFLHLIIGFIFIIFAGASIVCCASNIKKQTTSISLNNRSRVASYLNSVWNSNYKPTNYHLFSSSTNNDFIPLNLVDSEEEEINENILYSRNQSQNRQNPLTEVDWSIVGTGLDIDLFSQLEQNPIGISRQVDRKSYLNYKNKKEIFDTDDSDTFEYLEGFNDFLPLISVEENDDNSNNYQSNK